MAVNVYYIFGVCQTVTQSATIVANLLTIIAFANVRSLRTHTSNVLIFALSVTDFFWGIFQLLFYGVTFIYHSGPPGAEIGCRISVPFEYIYNAGNMLLIAISVDRVLLVSLNYSTYVKIMTARRLYLIIAACFLICLIGSIIELSLWDFAKRNNANAANLDFSHGCPYPPRRMKLFGLYVSLFFFILPLLLVGIFSVVFINRLLARIRKSRQIGQCASVSNAEKSQIDDPEKSDNPDGGKAVQKRYKKAAVTLGALVSAMCVSMLPFCTYLLVMALSGKDSIPAMLIMWYVLQLNPLLDPLFYAATQKDIKEFYGAKIRGLLRRCNSTP